ncbi:hypothetical protein WICMUC_001832 [Wickerhamomyces mucosus]|uniref:AAA+ ATPase domain-containing protein n=1 Tax=Wickerhamomyces mucosus TaxID=1378264 RepID=A0A9P8PS25_9ASCO|nr:hypothetical protein WICMUC_001832 [Wickerhamomyces mucosus]
MSQIPKVNFNIHYLDFNNSLLGSGSKESSPSHETSVSETYQDKENDFEGLEDFNKDSYEGLIETKQINKSKNNRNDITEAKIEHDNIEVQHILKFTTPAVEEIKYKDKEIDLPYGRRYILKRKRRKTKSLNSIELSRQEKQSYGMNLNDLYAKLEVERLQENTESVKGGSNNTVSYLKSMSNPDILWAEKWRPKTFFDFVGNESTNRKILKWIKQWDRVVFDKNFKPITTEEQHSNKSNNSAFSRFSDPFGRPERKVLLIHGPPGLGKTTVAHVIAKQAGYEVMEVNASDERSGQRVREKVRNSLSTSTFSGKPVCLIADEVDGAAEFGFIKVLSDILQDDAKTLQKFQNTESSKFFKDKSGKNKPKLLLRPIIAICNDLYSPALEKLRFNCEIITFQQATERALLERLKLICKAEKKVLTNQQLKEIILLTDFDIRSCLNILQFGGLDTKNSRKKDTQASWYSIVNEIFKRDPHKQKSQQFKEIANMIGVNTNFDKIVHGCFQAYHDIHYQDIRLTKPSKISDWLFFSDIMSRTQFESSGDLSHYTSQVALKFFDLFCDLTNRQSIKIQSDYEHFERRKNNANTIRILFNHTSPQLRSLLRIETLPLEVLSLLDYILTPDTKLNSKDIAKLKNSVAALGAFGLRIQHSKDENYNNILITYPQYTTISKFDKALIKRQQQRQTQSFPGLLKELERKKLTKRTYTQMKEGEELEDQGETSFQVLKDQYEKIAVAEQNAKKPKTKIKVWVKYHEGFSNAVRKNVKWSNLWQ